MHGGKNDGGVQLAVEARIIAHRMGSQKLEARALQMQAMLCASLGQFSRAVSLCEEARRLIAGGELQNSVVDLAIIDIETFVHFMRTNYRLAQEAYSAIMRIASPKKFDRYYVNSAMNAIHIDSQMGHEPRDILDRLDAVTSVAKRIGFVEAVWYGDILRGEIKQRERDPCVSEDYRRCLDLARATDIWSECVCLQHLSDLYLQERDFDEAFRWAVSYLARSRKAGMYHTLLALRRLADVLVGKGDTNSAETLYIMGLDAVTWMDVHWLGLSVWLDWGPYP
jgi:hypothetical protein